MIEKTEGLILRVLPYSRTSSLVDCLAFGTGRVWLLAKGAQRPKSPFLGQIDLFYTCELLFYRRAARVLVLKECAALRPRPAFRTDWRAAACASYLCDFTAQVAPPGIPHDELAELLDATLDQLTEAGGSAALLSWYELAALKSLGFGPALRRCPRCGRDPAAGGNRVVLSARQGGALCAACRGRGDTGPVTALTAGALAVMRAWEAERDPHTAAIRVPSPAQLTEIQAALRDFTAFHLDFQLRSRSLALELLRAAPPRPAS